jgi:hypothetical protein
VSPSLNDVGAALTQFTDAAEQFTETEHFKRRTGNAALKFLQEHAAAFVKQHLV